MRASGMARGGMLFGRVGAVLVTGPPTLVLQDGKECVVKEVVPGDSVNSLLSILDVITVSDWFGAAGRARRLGYKATFSGSVDWAGEGP